MKSNLAFSILVVRAAPWVARRVDTEMKIEMQGRQMFFDEAPL